MTPCQQGLNCKIFMASSGVLYLMKESAGNKRADVPLLLEMINKLVSLLYHSTHVFVTGGPFVWRKGKHGCQLYVYITEEETVLNAL